MSDDCAGTHEPSGRSTFKGLVDIFFVSEPSAFRKVVSKRSREIATDVDSLNEVGVVLGVMGGAGVGAAATKLVAGAPAETGAPFGATGLPFATANGGTAATGTDETSGWGTGGTPPA